MTTSERRARPLKDTMKACMLKPVRIAAGLGNPPNKWTNQRTEPINLVLKEVAGNQVTDQTTIHEIIQEKVIKQEESEYRKAIFKMGEYRLAYQYTKYAVSPSQWTKKSPQQQEEHMKKVFGAPVSFQQGAEHSPTQQISISVKECGKTSLGAAMLDQLWQKAGDIMSNYDVLEVGKDTFCVTQHGGSENVQWQNRTDPRCQCTHFRCTGGICSHILVVANKVGKLAEYLANYNRKSNKAGRVLQANIPKRAGEKAREKKKRRGANNIQERPVVVEEERVDRDVDVHRNLAQQ